MPKTVPDAAKAPRYCANQYNGSFCHSKLRITQRAKVTAGFKCPPDDKVH